STNAGSLTTTSVAVSPTANTTYTVTGTDVSHSCVSSTTVVVYMARNVAIQNPSGTICDGASVTLTASGASSYTWSTGATTNSIIVTPTVTTSYTVTGLVTCTNISTTTINVNAVPNLQVTASTTTLCAGTPATLTASGADTYSWSTSATTASIMVTPTITTIYTVTGTATSTNCKSTDTLSIIVTNCSTGINQLAGGVEQVLVYPNPTKDILYVSCKLKNSTLFITDILGNKIKQINADTELTSIDMSSLSEGVYFITIKTANNTITKKIVVQR
ncbi:MAG TPA: T9SS type A sorting domain-containing protein, partial [Bacteroidia bacterium]